MGRGWEAMGLKRVVWAEENMGGKRDRRVDGGGTLVGGSSEGGTSAVVGDRGSGTLDWEGVGDFGLEVGAGREASQSSNVSHGSADLVVDDKDGLCSFLICLEGETRPGSGFFDCEVNPNEPNLLGD